MVHSGIPLSLGMQLRIQKLTQRPFHIVVSAPLAPNVNVHDTAFAGSLYSLGTLAAWSLVGYFLKVTFPAVCVTHVVREATIRYLEPVQSDIICSCDIPDTDLEIFEGHLRQNGKARLTARVTIPGSNGDSPAVVLEAHFSARVTDSSAPHAAVAPNTQ
eukprot:TRINITY_DN11071_c0_g1_i1.p1 TRINITY_DN11071_c0_g1~~TRINITY_DN11071_c0_g1_i1.p1  ORF type:complete len:185 (-),score=15.95 TRINITY_DN11071_c0_g1_i1:63-539(-)